MTRKYEIKDSGKRKIFASGAARDSEAKPRLDLISPFFMWRLGKHLQAGAAKYAERNWEKGIPNSRYHAGIMRHMNQWYEGQTDEDHLSAAAFGIMGIIHNEHMVPRGLLPASLLDMPRYVRDEPDIPLSPPDNFSTVLRNGRHKKGWTQKQLARYTGVSAVSISHWENSKHRPSPLEWRRLKELLL